MLVKLKTHWQIIVLVLISIILCVANYTPGTFLSGWDTLHPEFNFGLNFQRTIFGVFRPEQGLGAAAGHSHMADLPRIIFLYISHFVLPMDFLRYFYIFINIIVGTLGMYLFLNSHLLKNKIASFLGALFYLLNVGSVQIFNVPFEMFTTLFTTLPFIFYYATSYILDKDKRRQNLFLFAVFSLLNSPSAYAATLWYVFFIFFLVYFFLFSLLHFKKDKKSLKHFLVLILISFTINLYWIIPNIYFVLNHAKEVAHANINRLFSEQAFLKNKEFGNFNDILLLKSFYLDWNIYQGKGVFIDLMLPWINHFKDIKVLILGYGFGLSFILGAIYMAKQLKEKAIPIFFVLGFSLIFLINDNFPMSHVYQFLQQNFPLFKEALRFPENKIFNEYIFLVSIFFGYFCLFAVNYITKIKLKIKNLNLVFAIIISILIIFYSLPSFSGNFINYYMRINIPNEYFKVFNYLKTQPDSVKVANLPIQSPWGWVYYDWYNNKPSYQGAGFLYFGIKQPLLDRDFDRWSPYNESYYREMSYAIYKEDKSLLTNVINKYKIGFIFIDKSVTDPQKPKSTLYFEQSKKLIEQTGLVIERKDFGNIEVFKLKKDQAIAESLNTNINVNPETTTTYHDFAYDLHKNYITSKDSNLSPLFFPFRDLIDNQSKLHENIVKIDNEKITLNPSSRVNNFQTSSLSQNLSLIPSDLLVEKIGRQLTISIYPNTPVFDNTPSTSPIKGSIDIGSVNRNLSISLNQNELFNIGNLPENTPIGIGKVLLKNDTNTVSAFDTTLLTQIANVVKIINPFFSSCKQDNPAPTAGFTDNGIKLEGKGDICILIPFGYFPKESNNKANNILTDFQFQFVGNAKITSCLFNQETSSCLYYRNPIRHGNIVSLPYVLSEDKTNKRAIKIFIESPDDKQNKYVLGNLTSWFSKSIVDLTLSKNFISGIFTKENNLSFDKIYLPRNIAYDPGFTITKIKKLDSDCKSSLSKAKKEIINQNGVESIKYTSTVGSFCDHFSYQDLPHEQGYLIVIDSKNESGLPLTLCVTNYTSRKCDVYSDLSTSKTFKKDIFLLPPMDKGGIGYDINLENLGINRSKSVNYLSSIEFIPLPYEFLGNIKTQESKPNQFNGKVEKVTKYNPASYLIETNGKPTVVSLYLSYETGFKAYSITCNGSISCFLQTKLAPFLGKEIKDHVLVNNWANGWIVNDKNIAIIFLPQYFEYLGLLLLLLTIGALGFIFINKHRE